MYASQFRLQRPRGWRIDAAALPETVGRRSGRPGFSERADVGNPESWPAEFWPVLIQIHHIASLVLFRGPVDMTSEHSARETLQW